MLPLCLPECQTPVTVPCGPEMMSFVRWHHVEMSNETTQKSRWTRTRPRMKLMTQHTSTAQHETIKTRRRNNEDIGCWLNTVGHYSCILQYFYCVCHHVCAYDFTCVPDTSNIVSEWHGCPNNGQYADNMQTLTMLSLCACQDCWTDRRLWPTSGAQAAASSREHWLRSWRTSAGEEKWVGRLSGFSCWVYRNQLFGLHIYVVWFTCIRCWVLSRRQEKTWQNQTAIDLLVGLVVWDI